LRGYAGNDTILGGDGDDYIDSGRIVPGATDDDTLTGGAGADQFVYSFSTQNGSDVITDFEDGVDEIYIRFSNGATFSDLTISSANGGLDTEIEYTGTYNGKSVSTTVLLEDVASTLIDASDFTFV
jgi:Ca2+-binding RTX toxin-like protein